MSRRILCPHHEEKTPSCIIYSDGFYHCFGCGAHGHSRELGVLKTEQVNEGAKYVEDVEPVVAYIKSLPVRDIRGLRLPYDDSAYYVLWPDSTYFKRRYFNDNGGSKYRGPAGVPKPLFKARVSGTETLIIIEGELNALSLLDIAICDIVSPGGCGDFASKRFDKDLQTYINYKKIFIVIDDDVPGTKAAISLCSKLKVAMPGVVLFIRRMKEDANEVLQKYGKEGIRKALQDMEMSETLQSDIDSL